MDGVVKRGRGRGRGTRARGRGRGRGKKAAVVVSSDETSQDQSFDGAPNGVAMDAEVSTSSGGGANGVGGALGLDGANDDVTMQELNKENEGETADGGQQLVSAALMSATALAALPLADVEEKPSAQLLPQTIDMEADISQLEAPTFTTITRGPPEPMLRLKWDHKVSLIGEKVLNPMIHCCDQCDKPILLYGRMIPCKHVFCLKCARTEPIKLCPRCNDKVVRVEQSGLGTVFCCTHGGSRYGNTGCRRTYLSQRDLQAHINHRHVTQPPLMQSSLCEDPIMDTHKSLGAQRKLSESSGASALHSQRPQQRLSTSGIGTILPPGAVSSSAAQGGSGGGGSSGIGGSHSHSSLTQANVARINTANAQECHQGKVALHQTLKKTPITQSHHQQPETVADASYYSSVLNSFGSGSGGGGSDATQSQGNQGGQGSWQANQYYR